MNFHNFLLLIYLPSTAMETFKMPSEYSVDFNHGFQEFSMANLEKGDKCNIEIFFPLVCTINKLKQCSFILSL